MSVGSGGVRVGTPGGCGATVGGVVAGTVGGGIGAEVGGRGAVGVHAMSDSPTNSPTTAPGVLKSMAISPPNGDTSINGAEPRFGAAGRAGRSSPTPSRRYKKTIGKRPSPRR